ncbi:MAG: hypothetical protein WBN77_10890 [Desulfobacterales bacterium]
MSHSENINTKELASTLEPMIRRVVREELSKILKKNMGVFQLTADMPLYKDMEEIGKRKKQNKINLHSHDEVWGE